ncbi:hypothetical protein ABN028_15955 [Actinopolymorpha sp. B17G11]|uniref:hypothetical protein n=1 Tax=Actinopolymorpha sp. B17G11 TaxID=3160861 RepID=UPI0032E443C8
MTGTRLDLQEQHRAVDAIAAVAGELRRMAARREERARDLFARAGYWRADPDAVEHSAVARALRAEADAIEARGSVEGGPA